MSVVAFYKGALKVDKLMDESYPLPLCFLEQQSQNQWQNK